MQDLHISLAHGNGGRYMRELITDVFARHLNTPELDLNADAACLPFPHEELVFTTDGFIVQPIEFPGGDIGSLAVHGTTNDLAVVGATPLYLSLNVFIEEGLAVEQLERIVKSLALAARDINVKVVAGDTKVLPRGEGGGLYLATTGVGSKDPKIHLSMDNIQDGDAILVSGPVGDHGIAVLLAREEFGLQGSLTSDAGSVLVLTQSLLQYDGLRFMRDPTRGGLATVAHEITHNTSMTVRLHESSIPVHDQVHSVCEMLGYDPYYLACEGRVVAIIDPEQATAALADWKKLDNGKDAQIIGKIVKAGPPRVILETRIGGERFLEELEDDPLPRIC